MHSSFLRALGLMVGVSTAALVASAPSAMAQTSARSFSVPAEALSGALQAFTRQSGAVVDFDKETVKGKSSSGVHGTYSNSVALEKLLAGTGLTAQEKSGGGYVIVTASSETMETVVVAARRDPAETDYNVNVATTSDRFGGTLHDLAQATSVVSAKVIADQQAQSVNEAIQNVSEATVNLSNQGGLTSFTVRGFSVEPLSNGMDNPSYITGSIDNIERIEVLQGPAAVLAGPKSEGGTVNVVTKKPTSERLLNVTAEGGSYGYMKGAVDASDALTDDGKLSGRLIISADRSDNNAGGYDGGHTTMVAPTLRYKDSRIDAIVGYTYTDQKQPVNPYTMFNTDTGKLYKRPKVSIGPSDQGITVYDSKFYYDISGEITPWLTAVSRGSYEFSKIGLNTFYLYGIDPVDGTTSNPYVYGLQSASKQHIESYADDTYLRAKFDIGPVSDTLVVGVNASHSLTDTWYSNEYYYYGSALGSSYSIDLQGTDNSYPSTPYTYYKSYNLNYWTVGGYFQDLIEYGPLHVSLGGRYNSVSAVTKYFTRSYNKHQAVHHFTPEVGVVYDITKTLSAYAGYTQGFIPNYQLQTQDGSTVPNNKSTNEELGVKWNIPDTKLSFTASVYRLTQSNLAISDPTNSNYYIAIPGEKTTGVQASLTGEILPGWNIIASATDASFSYIHRQTYASIISAQPRFHYSLYTSYIFDEGVLKNFGIGAGVYGKSGSYATAYKSATNANSVSYAPRVPGSTRVNANFFYSYEQFQLNLGIKNLLNTTDYGTSTSKTFVPVLSPRTFTLTLRYHMF